MPRKKNAIRHSDDAGQSASHDLPDSKPAKDIRLPIKTISLDGMRMRLDNNQEEGEEPRRFADTGLVNISQPTELGETIQKLNDDSIDAQTGMSKIDLNTRLGYFEVPSVMCVDALVSFRFLSQKCLMVTRQKKRLNVSLKGQGRQEIVDIVAGKRQHEVNAATGWFGGLKDKLTGGGAK